MTYMPERTSVTSAVNLYYGASGTASVGAYVSWASKAVTGHDFTLTQSGSTFTIPDDGHTYILEASLAPSTADSVTRYGVSFQWQLDGSTLAGNRAFGASMLNDVEYQVGFWGDERARCYVRGGAVARVQIQQVHGGAVTTLDGARYTWDAKARVLVWKL